MAAPLHLFEAGIVTEQRFAGVAEAPAALSAAFAQVAQPQKRVRITFNPRDRWLTAARESCRDLSDAVRSSISAGATCVILGGECTLVAGSIPGAVSAEPDLVLVYFDAHGDFNTLATTPTHFVGGMCLAHVCASPVAPLLWPGVRRISDDHVVLVGARDLDPGEAGNLARSRVTRIAFDREHSDAPGLVALVRRKPLWIHVDIDVVDPSDVDAVVLPVAGGPSLAQLSDLLRKIAAVATIRGLELCGYDPRRDPDGHVPALLAEALAPAVA